MNLPYRIGLPKTMRAETKKFIEDRQPHAAKSLKVVNVKLVGGKRPNDCSNNALDTVEEMDGVRPITGWLVNPVHPLTGVVEILAHWWNADARGNHFDTTPCMYDIAEYVEDLDLYMFAQKNTMQLKALLHHHSSTKMVYMLPVKQT